MVSAGVICSMASRPSSKSAGVAAVPPAVSAAAVVVAGSAAVLAASVSAAEPAAADESDIQFVRYLAQHRGDLAAVAGFWVTATAQVPANSIHELHQVFDNDRHVIRWLTAHL